MQSELLDAGVQGAGSRVLVRTLPTADEAPHCALTQQRGAACPLRARSPSWGCHLQDLAPPKASPPNTTNMHNTGDTGLQIPTCTVRPEQKQFQTYGTVRRRPSGFPTLLPHSTHAGIWSGSCARAWQERVAMATQHPHSAPSPCGEDRPRGETLYASS